MTSGLDEKKSGGRNQKSAVLAPPWRALLPFLVLPVLVLPVLVLPVLVLPPRPWTPPTSSMGSHNARERETPASLAIDTLAA